MSQKFGFSQESSCYGKDSYPSLATANRSAAALSNVRIKMGGYKCEHCKGFHIGHTLARNKQIKKVKRQKKKLNPLNYDIHHGIRSGYCSITTNK